MRPLQPPPIAVAAVAEPPAVNQIVQGNVLEVLPAWPDGCVDLVFADPPFNIGEYAAEVRVMMRPRATLRNWVIWYYTFGQNCKRKFNRSHAHLFYFVKDAKHFTFNAGDPRVRVPSDRQTKYNDKRANPNGRLPHDVWTFSRVCGTFKEREGWHPCQMPVDLLERIVLACSAPGEVVLDPFAGSGTTLVAAAKHERRWVGVELSKDYARQATRRVAEEMPAAALPLFASDEQPTG